MTIKEQTYQEALKGIKGVMEGETDIIANLANSVAILKEAFNFWWIGYYLVKNNNPSNRNKIVTVYCAFRLAQELKINQG